MLGRFVTSIMPGETELEIIDFMINRHIEMADLPVNLPRQLWQQAYDMFCGEYCVHYVKRNFYRAKMYLYWRINFRTIFNVHRLARLDNTAMGELVGP